MAFRCPECRTRRATWEGMQAHIKQHGHKLCDCGGYHYKHRAGSTYCHQNPCSALYEADRQGCGPEDLKRIAQHIAEITPNAGAKASEILKSWGIE